nr:PREDICTED: epithelial chloride channel protein-like [Anolis carolinensis]|eukprot:XP_016848480.1 PREDICTED: epithelial chloride channel protein-like [Anolis carolinensis]
MEQKGWPLFMALLLLLGVKGSLVKLRNGGYEDVVIGIDPKIAENVKIINSIKEMFKEASSFLFHASQQRFYFRTIKIVIPSTWASKPEYGRVSRESYENADIIVAEPFVKYGNDPYTLQYGGCGKKGRYIHFTSNFLIDESLVYIYGPRGRVLVHEWAHLRWGVFDEYSNDAPFYSTGANKSEATRYHTKSVVFKEVAMIVPCIKKNEGRGRMKCGSTFISNCFFIFVRAFVNKDPLSLFKGCNRGPGCFFRCAAGITGQYRFQTGTAETRNCRIQRQTELYEPGCLFIPHIKQTSPVSIMFMQSLPSVSQFCDKSNHNLMAPNMQNKMCSYKSTWEVIMNSADFVSSRALGAPPSDPTINLMKMQERSVCLVLDTSGKMGKDNRLGRLNQAAKLFLLQIIESGSWVGIVTFNNEAATKTLLQKIVNDGVRQTLTSYLPTTAAGESKICDGVLAGFQVFLNKYPSSEGCEIVLLTHGEDPAIRSCFPQIQNSGSIIHTIAFGSGTSNELEKLADMTGGLAFYATDSLDSNGLMDAFSGISSGGGDISQQSIQLESKAQSIGGMKLMSGIVTVDKTVGKDTFFLIIWSVSTNPPEISLTDPKGKKYTKKDFVIENSNIRTARLKIPGTAMTGSWVYSIQNIHSAAQVISITVTTRAASVTVPPVTVKSYMSNSSISFPNPMIIYAEVSQGFLPVIGAKVMATVESTSNKPVELKLLDDGAGADIIKYDGIYSRYFTSFKNNGRYSIKVSVHGEDKVVRRTHRQSQAIYLPGFIGDDGKYSNSILFFENCRVWSLTAQARKNRAARLRTVLYESSLAPDPTPSTLRAMSAPAAKASSVSSRASRSSRVAKPSKLPYMLTMATVSTQSGNVGPSSTSAMKIAFKRAQEEFCRAQFDSTAVPPTPGAEDDETDVDRPDSVLSASVVSLGLDLSPPHDAYEVDPPSPTDNVQLSLITWMANYEACMGAYQQILWEKAQPFFAKLSDEDQSVLTTLQQEADSLAHHQIQRAKHTGDTAGKMIAHVVAIRRHSWLSTNLAALLKLKSSAVEPPLPLLRPIVVPDAVPPCPTSTFGTGAANMLPLQPSVPPLPHLCLFTDGLAPFYHQWESITSDAWVLRIVQEDYALEFEELPPTGQVLLTNPSPEILAEIDSLLAKGAIRLSPSEQDPRSFFSRYFTVPKRGGGLCPILDLRALNLFVRPTKFRMVSIASILPMLHLVTAPRVFTKVVAVVAAHLRLQGFTVFPYLDDWLLVGPDLVMLRRHVDHILQLLDSLGLQLSAEKFLLIPSREIRFIGALFDSIAQTVSLPSDRFLSLHHHLTLCKGNQRVRARSIQVLLGHMASTVLVTLFARLCQTTPQASTKVVQFQTLSPPQLKVPLRLQNGLADALSRMTSSSHEWQLDPDTLHDLFRDWRWPTLFASPQNVQLPRCRRDFVWPRPRPQHGRDNRGTQPFFISPEGPFALFRFCRIFCAGRTVKSFIRTSPLYISLLGGFLLNSLHLDLQQVLRAAHKPATTRAYAYKISRFRTIHLNPPRPVINVTDTSFGLGNFDRISSAGSFMVTGVPGGGGGDGGGGGGGGGGGDTYKDVFPPNKITDLEVIFNENDEFILTWTAPGDDYDFGQADRYEIKMSEHPLDLTEANFPIATSLNTSDLIPENAGTKQSFRYKPGKLSKENGTSFYFAIRAIDGSNNVAEVSNIARATLFLDAPPTTPTTPTIVTPRGLSKYITIILSIVCTIVILSAIAGTTLYILNKRKKRHPASTHTITSVEQMNVL